MKNCIKCNINKVLICFPKDSRLESGYRNVCKGCVNLRFMNWKDSANFKEYQKEHRLENIDQVVKTQKKYNLKHKNRLNLLIKNKYHSDINFKLRRCLRNRISRAIKSGSAVSDLRCSIEDLKIHLQSKFKDGMSWENHGKWHIDHVKPLSLFNLTIREEFLKACHYSNLQPLWAKDNIRKSNKFDTISPDGDLR